MLHYTLLFLSGLTIDWKIDNSCGFKSVVYIYKFIFVLSTHMDKNNAFKLYTVHMSYIYTKYIQNT